VIWSARLSVGLERGFDQAILRVLPRSNLIRTLHCGDDLWTAGHQAARLAIGPSRDARHYAAEIPVGADASPRLRFLAFLGRQVPESQLQGTG